MRKITTLSFALGALAFSEVASAQTTLKFQNSAPNPRVTAFGYYVGPFTATVLSDPTLPTISIFCVDVLNSISWGQQWNVNRTSLGSSSLANTRHGDGLLTAYRKAAWLSDQYALNATTQWAGIQAAIWRLFAPNAPNGGASEAYWLSQANTFANSAAYANTNWNQYEILTGTNSAGRDRGGPQEFVTKVALVTVTTPTVTPEPATWLLLGTGLVGVLGFVAVRGMRV